MPGGLDGLVVRMMVVTFSDGGGGEERDTMLLMAEESISQPHWNSTKQT